MISFGLTGGIGMGKSTAAEFLRQRGVCVSDSDEIARQLVVPGQPALEEIRQRFGEAVIDQEGRLRRAVLAEIVFADREARQTLEAILHPRIRAVWQSQLESWRVAGQAIAVAVIPLLFETGMAPAFDKTVCVACTAGTQRQRLRDRGWSEGEIERRIAAQMPIEQKMALADYVVWTEGQPAVLQAQLERILS